MIIGSNCCLFRPKTLDAIWTCLLNSYLVRCTFMFVWEQLFMKISVSSLCDNKSGICDVIPSCCVASAVMATLCDSTPPPEALASLLSDDDEDLPVSEFGEIRHGQRFYTNKIYMFKQFRKYTSACI